MTACGRVVEMKNSIEIAAALALYTVKLNLAVHQDFVRDTISGKSLEPDCNYDIFKCIPFVIDYSRCTYLLTSSPAI